MAELRIRTSLSSKEVRRRYAGLPGVIAGLAPDPLGLRRLFFAIFARRLYELIYEAYVLKASGRSDSLGNSWRSLKASTIRKRSSPSFIARYPLSAKLLINRVTDRLLNSLKPGRIVSDTYFPPAEQKYALEINRLIMGSDVPYAPVVHKRRKLWPTRMKAWIADATNKALDAALIRLTKSFA